MFAPTLRPSRLLRALVRAPARIRELARIVLEHNSLTEELHGLRAELAASRIERDEIAAHLARNRHLLSQCIPRGTRPRQFVFLHIQKTAGISLLERLGQVFSYLRTAWVFSPAELDVFQPSELAHYDFVCGHFTARNLSLVRPGAFRCTFLREPVERVVSAYWYFRGYEGQPRGVTRAAVLAAKRMSFVDFLRSPEPEVRWHLAGHQCEAIAGDWTNPRSLPPADLVAEAEAGLARFDFVGVSERLQACLDEICRLAELPDLGPVRQMNTTATRPRVDELTATERDLVTEVCATDTQLYTIVRRRLDARLDASLKAPHLGEAA